MRVIGARLYVPIIGTAATAAAATGHTIILSLASAGAFSGTYASYRHGSVPFAMAVVCAVVSSFAVCASIGAIRRSLGSRAEAREFASRLPGDPNASTYFAALGVQFAVLLTLESLEQTLQFGHPLGLAASLGAPLLVGLAIQSAVGLVSTLLAFRVSRAIVSASLAFARVVAPLFSRAPIAPRTILSGATIFADEVRRSAPSPAPLASRLANRPPPLIAFT